MNAALLKACSTINVVSIVGVSAVNDGVAGIGDGCHLLQDIAGDARGHHHPYGARASHFAHHVRQRGRSDRTLSNEFGNRIRVDVEHDAAMTIAHQPSDDVGAHPAEADHAEFHRVLCRHDFAFRLSWAITR